MECRKWKVLLPFHAFQAFTVQKLISEHVKMCVRRRSDRELLTTIVAFLI